MIDLKEYDELWVNPMCESGCDPGEYPEIAVLIKINGCLDFIVFDVDDGSGAYSEKLDYSRLCDQSVILKGTMRDESCCHLYFSEYIHDCDVMGCLIDRLLMVKNLLEHVYSLIDILPALKGEDSRRVFLRTQI